MVRLKFEVKVANYCFDQTFFKNRLASKINSWYYPSKIGY